MFRILKHSTDDASAKRLKMRRADYTHMTRRALGLFDAWLADAAGQLAVTYKRARRQLGGHTTAARGQPWAFAAAYAATARTSSRGSGGSYVSISVVAAS